MWMYSDYTIADNLLCPLSGYVGQGAATHLHLLAARAVARFTHLQFCPLVIF